MKKKRITIRDVAREAGLSVSTVSGILNGARGYSASTARDVWNIANSLNYTPLASARALQSGENEGGHAKTFLITHIVSRNAKEPELMGEVEAAICSVAYKAQSRNYFVIPYTYHQLEGFHCQPLLNGYVEGALIGTPHLEVVQTVSAKVPTVLMDVPFSLGLTNVHSVNGDWNFGTAILLKRLAELGHRSIAFFQPYDKSTDMQSRNILWSARRNAEDLGMKISDTYSFKADFWPHNNLQMTREFANHIIPGIRKGEISAVFAPHPSYLKCLIPFLTEAQINIPLDCSLCAPVVSMTKPDTIASAWLDHGKIFDAALDLLQSSMEGKKKEPQEILLRPVLLDNKTLGPVRAEKEKNSKSGLMKGKR